MNCKSKRIPKIQVDEEQGEFQVDDDPFNSIKLDISNVPICITFTKVSFLFFSNKTQNFCQLDWNSLCCRFIY